MPHSVSTEWMARLPGLDRLWSLTNGVPEVRIAVLDGPLEDKSGHHSSLTPSSATQHATLVHSIIAGADDELTPGLAPGCTVISIPIFDEPASNEAAPSCTQAMLAGSIRDALDQRANIINISASQQGDPLSLSTELGGALQDALGADVLVVAAAGNQGCACDTVPACVAGVLAVGAHDPDGEPLLSSNWGPNQRAQGVLAPGRDIPGACVGGGLCRASGTSFATATVSGVAGLLMSADAERGIEPSGERIRRILLDSSVVPRRGRVEMAAKHLAGRLDISRAVDRLLASSAPTKKREETLTANASTDEPVAHREPAGRKPRAKKAECSAEVQASIGSAEEQASICSAEEQSSTPGTSTGLVPADCGCGGSGGECSCSSGEKKAQLAYAIGRIGVSFISQARRDSTWRVVNGGREGDLKPISNAALQELFRKQPFQAQSVVWTLSRTEVPMYAIVPAGAFAAETYKWLVKEWEDAEVEFASIPGVLAGQIALYDGSIVDALIPDLRGMFSWQTRHYVKALRDARRRVDSELSDVRLDREIERFLGKIYFSIRNRGLTPQERAINAAATNAFNVSPVIEQAGEEGLTLRDISAERSPLSRPGSDYYDVLLTFFNPQEREAVAPLRARFTIDVSDTVPVLIGEPVLWHEY